VGYIDYYEQYMQHGLVQGLSEGERVDLEVSSTGAVSPFTDLPVSL
jgi:hypothetical protein